MRHQLIGSGVRVTVELRELANRELAYRVSRFSDVLTDIWILVRNEDGPRDATLCRCRIVAGVRGFDDVIVNRMGRTPEAALQRSCRGLERELLVATSHTPAWRRTKRGGL